LVHKGKAGDIQQVARKSAVRCVLEGSVRKAGSRVRIGQLIDVATRARLWADKFDGAIEDVFELQDRITESVLGELAPSLPMAEIERARRKPALYCRLLAAFVLLARNESGRFRSLANIKPDSSVHALV
jgi:hypothetical protein